MVKIKWLLLLSKTFNIIDLFLCCASVNGQVIVDIGIKKKF